MGTAADETPWPLMSRVSMMRSSQPRSRRRAHRRRRRPGPVRVHRLLLRRNIHLHRSAAGHAPVGLVLAALPLGEGCSSPFAGPADVATSGYPVLIACLACAGPSVWLLQAVWRSDPALAVCIACTTGACGCPVIIRLTVRAAACVTQPCFTANDWRAGSAGNRARAEETGKDREASRTATDAMTLAWTVCDSSSYLQCTVTLLILQLGLLFMNNPAPIIHDHTANRNRAEDE